MLPAKWKSRTFFTVVVVCTTLAVWLMLPKLFQTKDRTPKKNYEITSNNTIRFLDSDEFLSSLVIKEAVAEPKDNYKLSSVGQIVLLIESGMVATGERLHPLHLDENYSKKIGLNSLSWRAGNAFVVSEISSAYKIKPGMPIQIARYGVAIADSRAVVRRIIKNKDDSESITLIFEIFKGQDWYPGANCKLIFPTLHEKPVAIAKRALLHLGDKDYVFIEKSFGEFKLQTIHVVDEGDIALSVTGLLAGDRILTKGSILLKNFIPELLQR
ncbi:MAG TPA: hypothetical protein PLY93_00340 [Turneriella sp.]|nr:hypothetical protein [Turneriella sp.]